MLEKSIHQNIEHLFRKEYGKVVALLVKKYGPPHLEIIEDAVQDAFIKAMKLWAYKEMPYKPTAWLYRVANNGIIDVFRKGKKMQPGIEEHQNHGGDSDREITIDSEISDSQLRMVFACCDSKLTNEQQLVLSLKLIGGFSNKELAEALLKKEEAVAKAFTRAKKKFKQEVKMIGVPIEMGLQSRLFLVLKFIYLLFSEGYSTTSGASVIKRDICYEALRLALLLKGNKYCQHPNLEALIALMCFHASRFDARLNRSGELVTLEHQDRKLYNQELIQIGIKHLENAGTPNRLPSNYHLEAAVSFYHSTSKTFEETDWNSILELYDLQLKNLYSPMVALNRIVPFSKVFGSAKALQVLHGLTPKTEYETKALFYAIEAALYEDLKQDVDQAEALKKAIALSDNELVKKHLQKKLSRC